VAVVFDHEFAVPPEALWEILGTPDRVDWVPGVTSCEFDGEVRRFKMVGAGGLAERINERDAGRMYLEYSVIESTPPLQSHVASITLEPHEGGTRFIWQTTVEPVAVEPFIATGMKGSLAQLADILASEN